MNFKTFGSALALLPALCAMPAAAQDAADAEIAVTGVRPDAHGPAGTMADHVHKQGDWMFGLMWMHESYGGTNRAGTTPVTPAQIAAAGYTVRDSAMTMDMAMLHVMYAPNDRVTLMLVPSWMRMGMTMEGLPATGMGGSMGSHGAHMLMPGQTMSHSVEGIGDTQFGALVSLSRRPQLSAHAGLMVSAPTGSVSRRNASGAYVHYMMQGGSGTWDLNPSFTLHGTTSHFGWGAQVAYLFRAEDANKSGFRFGDRFTATAWASKPVTGNLSLSARLAFSEEGTIKGHYNGAHGHASPPDLQGNYGGTRLDAGIGANLIVARRVRLGVEAAVPIHQDLNGIQLPRRFSGNVSASLMF
ncbi:hypothetical protein [Novosphingobium sp. TH158]|uniref:hypothetical protein n=1 Tax=Novosphingobium sp. TH158 TaxID=2067455 RepID=UPI000C7E17CF|nr:hypothetical protein [Novosphingobium sp. TH158]PLK27306.1 hypothetical protein C0V78_10725 [Novosphingobium sp. TH158]